MATLAQLQLHGVTVRAAADGSAQVLGGGLPVFLTAAQVAALAAALPLTDAWRQFTQVV